MLQTKKASFYTLGCKLNFSETSTISRQLSEIGFTKVDFTSKADLVVINTCSVTENANRECKRIIKKAKKISPLAYIIVTGCFAQLKPKLISEIPEVNLVLGAQEKFNIPKLIKNINKEKIVGCELENLAYESSFSLYDRTRSFLKIQDGCDYPCTYCTIPLARGKSRCDSVNNIIKNINIISKRGVKEIVLTGVNIGEFKDNNNNFSDLVAKIDENSNIDRFRISSIEPNKITNDVINIVKNSNSFMPHFHIPLQSGSDLILSRMKRRYNTKLYANKINLIYDEIKNVCIGVDVIVGFPGETKEEFEKTINFIKSLPISYLHVFTYSERDNTEALKLSEVVNISERKERSKKLRILSNKLRRSFYEKFLHSTQKVLFEHENKNGFLYGFTENYIKVKIKHSIELSGSIQTVYLQEIDTDGIMNIKII